MSDDRPNTSESTETRHSIVQDLARNTSASIEDSDGKPVFGSNDTDSPLNPRGPNFNARAWATNIARGQNFRRVGLCFQNLSVFGYGTPTDFQKDVGNIWIALPNMIRRLFSSTAGQTRINILNQFDGLTRPGEMCIVLGPPGSDCSMFLKSLSGDHNGFYVNEGSYFNYHGMSDKEMHTAHRGDAIYTAEVDVHFPILTVGETLTFASRARCQRELPQGISRNEYCELLRDVIMAMYGISHTINTKVGDEFTRGVSGGERKRVTIAEATLANAPFQCWDNSTRGLDSANTIEFCKTLRLQSELFGQTCFVSMYQAPQSAYDLFDKTTVLYEGRQIYFGPVSKAKGYFINLGFECPSRQTTPDFLTSMTFPAERITRPNCNPPRTPDEFVAAWKNSPEYKALQVNIEEYKGQHPIDGPDAETFRKLERAHQSKGQHIKSPYILTYSQQVQLCIWRGFKRLRADPWLPVGMIIGNTIMALIISSLFYNLGADTSSFYGRAAVLFVAILFNAFASMLEIMTLYAQRPIVEKQSRYAFYHPSAESYASVLVDLPLKFINAISFNLVFYFMTNLNRSPGPFFFYLFVVFWIIMAMSGVFRSVASVSRTEQQAMVPASILLLALLIFTGFVVPVDYMLGWCRWINYLDPVAYGYEALMVNEFHGRNFSCSTYIPDYADTTSSNIACAAVGTIPDQSYVNGDDYINSAYKYYHSHKSRNVGIIIAMAIFNHIVYFIANQGTNPKNPREWVKPGTLTALMGVSGAGKTTLLDCLADRRTGVGVISGEILVEGKMRDESFQRKFSYAQQQDLHLETSTVREALAFSALLRQSASRSKVEKLAWVNKVIDLLDMEEYADAVVGVLGEGLNVEQRKRLTIGVELAARPQLLIFVDEPTSGLDSQTSWAVLNLLEKLSKAGQAILCTIHQPSAMLFQRFDRFLLLADGGRTVYFGEIGDNSHVLTEYFERHGASCCPPGANPAEWMLEAIGAAPGSHSGIDWYKTWCSSLEYQAIREELARIKAINSIKPQTTGLNDPDSYREFAAPLWEQFLVVTQRVFQQYWRTPSYIYSKLGLCIGSSLFIGLIFLDAPLTIQGLQNQTFAIFELASIFGQLVDQQLPNFVTQRSLYEVRERPAKTYSWIVFMLSQIVVEIPWSALASIFMWAFIYFPVGFYKNAEAAGQSNERGGIMWLLFLEFVLFVSSFAHMCISVVSTAD
ncbi:ABC transporter G family member 21 [Daldinia childiae]|uniref:ABC transporter G family member 21 n=1 Tax=Daldinia childiae TaxID=326645 RepID=UPI001444F2B1|nr:ABC transporter G family member 21 [Daldinia childiae]KAF3059990.1 ABC transporter G family member 21 [Daldinia childiae]